MKKRAFKNQTFWIAGTTLFTALLFLAAVGFGLLQWRVLKEQTAINSRLANNQIRAVLELSFSEAGKKLTITNVGQLVATDIAIGTETHGKGMNSSSAGNQDDLNPGESAEMLIQVPDDSKSAFNNEAAVMDIFLEYASEHDNVIKRRFTFFWLDGFHMWRKGQWH